MTELSCPVCTSKQLELFLKRKNVPVHQNLLCNTSEAARNITRGDLDLTICHTCSFIFNGAFDLDKLSYGDNYDNTQICSPFFDRYINELVEYLIYEKNIKNSKIVEVGCGQGDFIKRLIEKEENNNIGFGFDPSYKGELTVPGKRLNFRKQYYGKDCTDIKADIVISRHVIEHVPEPYQFLLNIKESVIPETLLFFETPCVNWILKNNVFFDFFYEHCSYFNINSLKSLFHRAGFAVQDIKRIFGDQYLWLEAANKNSSGNFDFSNDILELARNYKVNERLFIDFWQNKLQMLSESGNVAVWGAGAKGVTFANMVDPEGELIKFFIDLNPNKHNHFIPGTGNLIGSYHKIADFNIKYAVVMNSNYIEENKILLAKENLELNLLECQIENLTF